MTSRNGGDRTTLDRRTLVRMLGAGAVATGLAGCDGATQQSYEFTAAPVEYGGDPGEAGYAERSQQTVTSKRTESVGGVDAEVTVNSQVTIYSSERDTEPMDVDALWAETDAVLADWTGGGPMPSARASEIVDGESLTLRTGDGETSIPAAAAQVWPPNSKFDELSVEDLLVAVPASELGGSLPAAIFKDRDTMAFDGQSVFPTGTAMDFVEGIFVEYREGT